MASTAEKDVARDRELNGELYNALLKEEDAEKTVMELCQRTDDHALHILTIHGDTVLHKATYSKQANLVLKLLEALPPRHLHKMICQNDTGNTILHEAATLNRKNSIEVATKMLEKAPELLRVPNKLGETALFRAARYGKTKIFNFLADKIEGLDEASQQPFIQRKDKTTILHIAILAQRFGLALEIANRFGHIIDKRDKNDMTALQLLSLYRSAFKTVRKRELPKKFFNHVEVCWSSGKRKKLEKKKLSNKSALELANLLVEKDTSWELTSSASDQSKPKAHKHGSTCSDVASIEKGGGDETGDSGEGLSRLSSSISLKQVEKMGGITPLFLATKSGSIKIVEDILQKYPQAVEYIDNEGQTILHVAINYRQLEVFNLVLKMKVAKRWLVRRLDDNGNSILHMVGVKRDDYVRKKLRGPAFELQEELLWFERVKEVTKAHFIDHQNNMRQTAEGLFESTYKDLQNDAKEWLKHTAEGCSIVAVLIATVAFAAAYTIPGGPNESTGIPLLLSQPFFVVFTASDVLSLASALTSVVLFLSILTAPYRLHDFRHKLPNKLMLGVTFLFLSVLMMMISFAATIVLMIRGKESWIKAVLYSLSFLPVGIFALSYLPLYVSLTRTYKYLLKKIKQAIPWSAKRFPCLSKSCNCARLQLTGSTKHKSEREDFNSLAALQTSHLSV